MQKLKFSDGKNNGKLKQINEWLNDDSIIIPDNIRNILKQTDKPKVYTFSLPSGFSCPQALDCMSKADRTTGRITDSKNNQFRCFSATTEAMYPTVRKQRWHNFDLLKRQDLETMVNLIIDSLPIDATIIRVHVGGDFFNEKYFQAWQQVARLNPNKLFYSYTKSIPYWINNLDLIPGNFILNASYGGRSDYLIDQYNLKSASVVFSEQQAIDQGLLIDHDERHAIASNASFALLLHGTQPKNTPQADAKKQIDRLEKLKI
jgi:hypothetical protein